MVDACSRKCRAGGCSKKPSLGVANTRTTEYRAQHGSLKCVVEGYNEREDSPRHSGKEVIGSVNPSNSKKEIVHSSPSRASPPLGGSRGSRKRARRRDITSMAPTRAVALLESSGGAVTIPDIDGQQSPVKRDSSVKTEVQFSL